MPDSQLLTGIPVIRRARGFRLYDMQGRRYLDLFRDGALMGHRAAGVLTAMKSALSQGLAAALPSVWEMRLISALARSFPQYPQDPALRLAGPCPRRGVPLPGRPPRRAA